MSGRIPQHFIDELIARTDLVELIGGRVPLKKQGKEFKACCPFHGEKTPSFTVVPDKQFYHCFGCGAHGTELGFLIEHDHLSFVEAVEELAARLGLDVPREQQNTVRPQPSDRLFAVLEKAAELYRRELRCSDRGKDYFESRGLTGDTAARFGLGYAPDAWDFLLKQLGAEEADRHELQQVGLIIERERKPGAATPSGHYDRFRDRVMFPIRDARGRTIGFGGRVLDKGEPKYLNSPETELFHKGRELYGLYEARQASRTLTRLVVVEGYMDVVRLHQAGITYAVATLGTATTPEHLGRIFRICNELVFCFDGDRAGRAAAWRALENSLREAREGREIKFLFLPDGHDPDSLVGQEGRDAFEARLQSAVPLSKYLLEHLGKQVDLSTWEGRAKFTELARPLVERIPEGVFRDLIAESVNEVVERYKGLATAFRAPRRPAPSTHGAPSARPNLVRQIVRLLVHYPQIADRIGTIAPLASLEKPGISLIVALIQELQHQPCTSTGALLERWRGRPDVEHLAKLAALKSYVPDAAAAVPELLGAIEQLNEEAVQKRREELLSKHGREGLSATERTELQGLLRGPTPEPAGAERRT